MREPKKHTSAYLPVRIKRQVQAIVADHPGMSMNDFIVQAIKNEVDRYNANYSAPDFVLERVSEVINSQISVVALLNKQNRKIEELKEMIEDLQ